MSRSGRAKGLGLKQRLTDQKKALTALLLSQKVGYLRVEDFPDRKPFDDLPTQGYSPHKIIRCRKNELLLVQRGLVELWHAHHDMLVKKLMIGALFGEMPLIGQTMVITQALAGDAGTIIAMLDEGRVRELIRANPVSLAEKLYPKLAAAEAAHYRVAFQTAASRLAALLLELAGESSTVGKVKQRQISEMSGLVRETVAQILSSMKSEKMIAIERDKTTILDRKALEQLSRM